MFTHARRPYQGYRITSGKTHPRFQGILGFLDQLLHISPESGDNKQNPVGLITCICQIISQEQQILSYFQGCNNCWRIIIFISKFKSFVLKDNSFICHVTIYSSIFIQTYTFNSFGDVVEDFFLNNMSIWYCCHRWSFWCDEPYPKITNTLHLTHYCSLLRENESRQRFPVFENPSIYFGTHRLFSKE